jgi:predicted Zn-dependent protease
MKRSPELQTFMHATTFMDYGTWYMLNDWPSHALRAIRKVLSAPKFDDEAHEMAQSLSDASKEMIQFLTTRYELPFEKAEQASWYNEQAQLALLDNNLREVEHMAKEALKIAPTWTAPQNNFAHALYFSGKCLQAIAEAETVIRDDPDNIHGLTISLLSIPD